MNISEIFLLYLGNWQIMGMVITCYILILRKLNPPFYNRLWHSIEIQPTWILVTVGGLFALITREMLVIPLFYVEEWMPGSFLWEQVFVWLYATHFWSILIYFSLFLFYWKRFKNIVPAAFVLLFVIGLMELTFIPQHWLVFNTFLGSWYLPFIAVMMLFIVEYRNFKICDKRKLLLGIGTGIALQYLIIPFIQFSMAKFSPERITWVINTDLLPHPPWQTWVYAFLQSCIKIAYVLGFTQISVKTPLLQEAAI